MCCGTCGVLIVHYVKKFPSMKIIACYQSEEKANKLEAILNEQAKADLPDNPAFVGGNKQFTTKDGLAEIEKYGQERKKGCRDYFLDR